jgi:hypothetical protein
LEYFVDHMNMKKTMRTKKINKWWSPSMNIEKWRFKKVKDKR